MPFSRSKASREVSSDGAIAGPSPSGDNTIAALMLRAAGARHGDICLIQIDTHPDTWHSSFEHADRSTVPGRAFAAGTLVADTSIRVGIRGPAARRTDLSHDLATGFRTIRPRQPDLMGVDGVPEVLTNRTNDGVVDVTIDIDVLDPAPGAVTAQLGGVNSGEPLSLVRRPGESPSPWPTSSRSHRPTTPRCDRPGDGPSRRRTRGIDVTGGPGGYPGDHLLDHQVTEVPITST